MPVLAADYSALNTLALRPAHEWLRARHLTFGSVPGLLLTRCFPPCVEPGLLRAQPSRSVRSSDCSSLFPSRFATLTDCSVVVAWLLVSSPERSVLLTSTLSCPPIARCATLCASHRTRIASRTTLDLPSLARIAPRLRLTILRCSPIARRSSLGSPCLSWIAPSPAATARTDHRLLRDRHLTLT